MNTNTNTTKALIINIEDDYPLIEDGYPLFKAVSFEEACVLAQSGGWVGYWVRLVKYSVEGTTLTIYHSTPSYNEVSLYYQPSDEMVEKMAEGHSLLAPARILAEHLGLEKGVYFTTRNFDDATGRPRSVGVFSPLLNKDEVEGYSETTIDLNEVDPAELNGYYDGHRYPQGANFHCFEGRRYPQRVKLHNFYDVERDHIVSFIRQIRRRVMS